MQPDAELKQHVIAVERPAQVPRACSFHPLVENAIKHGVSAVEQNGIVEIRATARNGVLFVEVFDNGPGFPEGFAVVDPSGGGHGLRNITERLKGYYGDSAALCCRRWNWRPA